MSAYARIVVTVDASDAELVVRSAPMPVLLVPTEQA